MQFYPLWDQFFLKAGENDVTWSLGIIVRSLQLDRSLTHEVFRFLTVGGDLVAKSAFQSSCWEEKQSSGLSNLKSSWARHPWCHSLAGGRREVKWERSCSRQQQQGHPSRLQVEGSLAQRWRGWSHNRGPKTDPQPRWPRWEVADRIWTPVCAEPS